MDLKRYLQKQGGNEIRHSPSILHSSFSILHLPRRGFTLLELLVVIAIMGLLGTASVGGYRAMQRGMEERGVMQNVNQFIRAAYQRAQIDRQPVAVYFWNETLREETDTQTAVVVGKAVAVRRSGRVTYVQGNYIGDEYADLRFNRQLTSDGKEDTSTGDATAGKGSGVFLYRLNGNEGTQMMRTLVAKNTVKRKISDRLLYGQSPYLNGDAKNLQSLEQERQVDMEVYAYQKLGSDSTQWSVGDAYGFEFAQIELPANYIFGSSFSQNTDSPVKGEQVIRFKVSANSGSGAKDGETGNSQIEVSSIRQIGGSLTAKSIGKSDKPTEDLQ